MPRAEGRRRVKMADDFKDTGFYNAQDGLKGRDGGPYLDAVHRQEAEVRRAQQEQREPADLNGPLPADAGTLLVTARQLQDNSDYSNPSMAVRPGFEIVLTDDVMGSAEFNPQTDEAGFADPISVLPVDQRTTADNDNVADQTVTGNPSVAGIEEQAGQGNDVVTGAQPNNSDDSSSDSSEGGYTANDDGTFTDAEGNTVS